VNFKRVLLIAGASMCVLGAYIVINVALERVASWVEVKQDGYLWWREEWLQLFGANNFVDRGKARILLAGSSEVREGFLFDDFEAEFPGFDVYNNALSSSTLESLLVVLRYIEIAYGRSAMPEKIVLGVTPLFLLEVPTLDKSYLPGVIDRYSPFVRLDIKSRPARLVRKGRVGSLVARYRYLTHQSRRYQGALRGVMRAAILAVSPGLANRYWVRFKLVPSIYHHLPPRNPKEHLERFRRNNPPPPDPVALAASVRTRWSTLQGFMADYNIDLYVVNMPQSTSLRDDFFADTYDEYEQLLRSLVGEVPFLDLARFLPDADFYDITHPNLAAAQRISRLVAHFMHEADLTRSSLRLDDLR
jgi:hypothetical protein